MGPPAPTNLTAVFQNQAPLPQTRLGQRQAPHIQSSSAMSNNVPSARLLAQRKGRERAERSAGQQLQTPMPTQNTEPAPHTETTTVLPVNARSLGQQRRREREAAQRLVSQQVRTVPRNLASVQDIERVSHNPVSSARSMDQQQHCAHEAAQRLANQQLHTPTPTQNMEHDQNLDSAGLVLPLNQAAPPAPPPGTSSLSQQHWQQ